MQYVTNYQVIRNNSKNDANIVVFPHMNWHVLKVGFNRFASKPQAGLPELVRQILLTY